MSFKSLKSQGSLLSKLNAELNKTEGKSGYIDERLWKPTMGKDGVGSAVIRFLPCAEGNEMPWAKVWSHAFQGPGGIVVLTAIKKLLVNRNVNFLTTAMFILLKILPILNLRAE